MNAAWHGLARWAKELVRFAITIAVIGLVLVTLAGLFSGFEVRSFVGAVELTLMVAVLNILLWPILIGLALRLTVVFVLLATLILNGLVVWLAAQLLPDVVCSPAAAIGVAIVMAVVATVLESLLYADRETVNVRVIRRRARRAGGIRTSDVPGVIFFEIDGLGEQTLREALDGGHLPHMAGWLAEGSHKIVGWECDLSSQTGASQAGLLLGSNVDMPGFRWYEKDSGRIMVSNHPKDAEEIERRHSDGAGLLAVDGAAVGNLVSGDAPRSLATMSTILVKGRETSSDFFAYFGQPHGFIRTLALSVVDIVREKRAARAQERADELPRLGKAGRGGIYPLLRVSQTVVCRDLNVATLVADMYVGVPVAYSTFVAYDEVAHHSGITRPDALKVLEQLDGEIARLDRARALAPRPYHLVVLSDHGQSQGATFLQRYGRTFEDLVNSAIEGGVRAPVGADEGGAAFGVTLTEASRGDSAGARVLRRATRSRMQDGVVALDDRTKDALAEREVVTPAETDTGPAAIVLASGNLGLVSLTASDERMTLEEIEAAHPGLVKALRDHEGIGWVMVRSAEHGPIALGPRGTNFLTEGRVEGDDPLAPFGENAAWHLLRHDSFRHCPDLLVNSFFDPQTEEICAFEELVGAHGGMGGRQMFPFAVVPSSWSTPDAPIVGVEQMHRVLRTWLGETGLPVAPRPGEISRAPAASPDA